MLEQFQFFFCFQFTHSYTYLPSVSIDHKPYRKLDQDLFLVYVCGVVLFVFFLFTNQMRVREREKGHTFVVGTFTYFFFFHYANHLMKLNGVVCFSVVVVFFCLSFCFVRLLNDDQMLPVCLCVCIYDFLCYSPSNWLFDDAIHIFHLLFPLAFFSVVDLSLYYYYYWHNANREYAKLAEKYPFLLCVCVCVFTFITHSVSKVALGGHHLFICLFVKIRHFFFFLVLNFSIFFSIPKYDPNMHVILLYIDQIWNDIKNENKHIYTHT